ncbi:MAG: CCA tRNA nucleotidyltransferase [Lachnospiraceae bacterium]|nr:CCA tRNA nucleotidyltransferase [Lachnospiraceae bacterium]
MNIPQNASFIIDTLNNAGYEAYVVGGCVRDAILGRVPQDWDITTSALPEQVKALFRRTIDTGIQHGTVTVMLGKEGYEVTTYRIDGEYHDGRHPDQVTFTRSLSEDLLRRDFTINAMAYHPQEGLVDLFGGQPDLKAKIIRAVGVPKDRFSEDALRMLRAVRFAGQLGFAIENETKEAIKALAPTLTKISEERIREEFTKLLLSPQPELLDVAIETGMTDIVLPEVNGLGIHLQEAYDAIRVLKASFLGNEHEKTALCYALLLAEAGGAEAVCKRLKFDNETIQMVRMLYENRNVTYTDSLPDARRLLHRLGEDNLKLLFAYQRAALTGCGCSHALAEIEVGEHAVDQVLQAGDCYDLKQLAVKGADLIAAGFAPGKMLGDVLAKLLDAVIEEPSLNQKENLIVLAQEMQNDHGK